MIKQKSLPEQIRDDVYGYIAGVQSGSVVTGKLVRQCVERHVQDLQHAHERGWWFDADKATRACAFFPAALRHSIGEFAGEPFELSPWQQFIVWTLFGWVNAQTKLRRFRTALIEVARKNGKTTFAAGIALRAQYQDEPFEPGAQVYATATKEDQAKLLYREAERMVMQCPWLVESTKIRKVPAQIELTAHGSYFRPLGSDGTGTDGLNPHLVIQDELHAWREHHREFREKLSSGFGARRQPMELITTTAGDRTSQLWIEEHDYAAKVLASVETGNVVDDTYFAYIAAIDDEDDWENPDCWVKANPNLGVSVKLDFLQAEANKARHKPTAVNQFLRYHCNRMTEASERAISVEAWQAGAKELTVEPGAYAHGGIDVGRSNDWCGVAMCFPVGTHPDDETKPDHWELVTKAWTCRDGEFAVDHEPFRTWIRDGLLECCAGDAIDLREVEAWIVEQSQKYDVRTWAYDQAFARDLAQRLQDDHGLQVFQFTQGPKFYNEPFRRIITELADGRIWHGNDPVLSWQAANVECVRNAKDEWMPNKGNRVLKIDSMVAAIMAFSECLFAEKQTRGPKFVFPSAGGKR